METQKSSHVELVRVVRAAHHRSMALADALDDAELLLEGQPVVPVLVESAIVTAQNAVEALREELAEARRHLRSAARGDDAV